MCFPEYTGANEYEEASYFIQNEFERLITLQVRERFYHSALLIGWESNEPGMEVRRVYSHRTCATDRDNLRAVFDAVKDIIIRMSLSAAGLMSGGGGGGDGSDQSNNESIPAKPTTTVSVASNEQLMEQQRQMIAAQDAELDALSAGLANLKAIGASINAELETHNKLLAELDESVDKIDRNIAVTDQKSHSIPAPTLASIVPAPLPAPLPAPVLRSPALPSVSLPDPAQMVTSAPISVEPASTASASAAHGGDAGVSISVTASVTATSGRPPQFWTQPPPMQQTVPAFMAAAGQTPPAGSEIAGKKEFRPMYQPAQARATRISRRQKVLSTPGAIVYPYPPEPHDLDPTISDDESSFAPKPIAWTDRPDAELKLLLSPDLYESLALKKQRLAAEAEEKRKQNKKDEIDHVFADMENSFNGMSAASIFWENHCIREVKNIILRVVSFLLFYLPMIVITYVAVCIGHTNLIF